MLQQTVVFGIGAVAAMTTKAIVLNFANTATAFNNSISLSPYFPFYGKIGNPHTFACTFTATEVAEGCEFSTTLYGATRTYLGTKFVHTAGSGTTEGGFGIRYD
jgi:hypothetical protein